jgi:hypothetical protein
MAVLIGVVMVVAQGCQTFIHSFTMLHIVDIGLAKGALILYRSAEVI